jgi:hypothetical protein
MVVAIALCAVAMSLYLKHQWELKAQLMEILAHKHQLMADSYSEMAGLQSLVEATGSKEALKDLAATSYNKTPYETKAAYHGRLARQYRWTAAHPWAPTPEESERP